MTSARHSRNPGKRILNCHVCGHDMTVLHKINDARGVGAQYSCKWCQAVAIALSGKEPLHLPYRPIDERWAACTVTQTGLDLEHAAHGDDSTLCGLSDRSLTVYRHHWHPGPRGCPVCEDVARTVDARWPQDKR